MTGARSRTAAAASAGGLWALLPLVLVLSALRGADAFPNGSYTDPVALSSSILAYNYQCPTGDFINTFQLVVNRPDEVYGTGAFFTSLYVSCHNGTTMPNTATNVGAWGLGCHHFSGVTGVFNRTCTNGNQRSYACLTALQYTCYLDPEYSGSRIYRNETFNFNCPAGQYISGVTGKRSGNQIIDMNFNCSTPRAEFQNPVQPITAAYYVSSLCLAVDKEKA